MGLDITAYGQLEKVMMARDDDENLVHVFNEECFLERLDSLEEGYYRSTGAEIDFRAGSYGGYNVWRDNLAKMLGYESARYVWLNYENGLQGKPFVELIHFSDCEGIIGPVTSVKLAKDFETFKEKAQEFFKDDEWDQRTYQKFHEAFKLAAGKGAVKFH